MSVTLQLHQVTSIQPGPLYRVKNEILSSEGIPPEVFVYKTVTQVFDHYATVADMKSWSNSWATAKANGDAFYRQSSKQVDYAVTDMMQADLNITKQRLQSLLNQTNALQVALPSDSVITITGV